MKLGFRSRWLSFRLQTPTWPRRFSVTTLLWMVTLLAVLFAWWRDHQQQGDEIRRIRGEIMRSTKRQAAWGVEQLLGPPDTAGAGDIVTAWASATPDQQPEWIVADFRVPVSPSAVEVHETYNPGALVQVSGFDPLGREVTLWRGVDPTPASSRRGISKIPVETIWKIKRVKLYFDSPAVAGWNEIDAVGLYDAAGQVQWAEHAMASSAFGGRDSQRRGAGMLWGSFLVEP